MKKGRQQKQVYFRRDYYVPRSAATRSKKKLTQFQKFYASLQKTMKQTGRKLAAWQKSLAKAHARKLKTRKQRNTGFSWREVTLMSLVGGSAMMIALALVFTAVFDPVKRSEREISKLAEDYYVKYLYPRALGKYLDQPKLILRDYTEKGLPSVRLNQLLSYNSDTHSNSAEIFSNAYYQCDTNATYAKYYPIEPYGPRDFTVSYNMACERPGEIE